MDLIKKLLPLTALATITALIIILSSTALAQTSDSRVVVNMTGVNASRLVITHGDVSNSRFVTNTLVIEVGLHGVQVYPISVHFGLLRENDIKSTDSVFTILNAGVVAINLTISVNNDWTGATGNWVHSDDCEPGVNTVGLRAIVGDDDNHTSIIVKKTEPYNYLITDLQPDESITFALELYAPTTIDDYSQKSNGIYVNIDE